MNKTDQLLTRGVEQILPTKDGLENLMSKKKIRVYLGIDPTGTRLHLGHSIALRKLQAFADAGHEAILLFGTGTVLAGDPSQREAARAKIAAEQIETNIATWRDQVKSIIDFNKVRIMFNGEWLLSLNLRDIIEIASHISATQLMKRDMFQKRLEKGDTIWTHEILYPLLQGYDSVAMDVDLEIGGTDQTFNMLIGRELLSKMKGKEKYVLSVPMITGTDGKQMSKSSGNCIWLADTPSEMFGKTMSIGDSQIEPYMNLLTNMDDEDIEKSLENPMNAKKKLAYEIVKIYHSEKDAKGALEYFENTFQKKEPEYSTEIPLKETIAKTIADFTSGSTSDAKRLISQGAVSVNGEVVKEISRELKIGDKLKIGATTFGRVVN